MDSSNNADKARSDSNPRRRSSSSSWTILESSMDTEPQRSAGLQEGHSRPHLLQHHHHRRRFNPTERAETAAVRKVGACSECHARKVKCRHTVGSLIQGLSVDSVDSEYGSSQPELSHPPSLSNSRSVLTSPEQSTILQRNSGEQKMQDSVMLEKFVHENEGSVRWLEKKPGYSATTLDGIDDPVMFGYSGLESVFSYPRTIDLTDHAEEDLIVFPSHTPLPGEQMPWEFISGRETTQPRRSNTRGQIRGRAERRRVAGGIGRRGGNISRSRAPQHRRNLSHGTQVTANALADLTLNPTDASQQSIQSEIAEVMDDTWDEPLGETDQPLLRQETYGTQQPEQNAPPLGQHLVPAVYAPNTSWETRTFWPLDEVLPNQHQMMLPATSELASQPQVYGPDLFRHHGNSQLGHDSLNSGMATTLGSNLLSSATLNTPVSQPAEPTGLIANNQISSHQVRSEPFARSDSFVNTGVPMINSRSYSQERSTYPPQSSFFSHRNTGLSSSPYRRAESIAEGVPSSFDSRMLSPQSFIASSSPQQPSYLQRNHLSLPQTPYGMSRQPSLAGKSTSTREDNFLISPELPRENNGPQGYFEDSPSPSLRPTHQTPAMGMHSTSPFPQGLDVEYTDGAFGKEPIQPFSSQFSDGELDELLRIE